MTPPAYPSLSQATRIWAHIGLVSFGGPAGQIALMHRILVQERRWLGEKRFLHALNYCMLLPGPEAMQLAVYVGWLLHGIPGGVIAGALFVLPGALAVMALSWVYALFGAVGAVEALFFGLKAAVLAIVVQALLRIGARVLTDATTVAIAALAFVAIFGFGVPFPLIVLAAGLFGYAGARAGLRALDTGHTGAAQQQDADDAGTLLAGGAGAHVSVSRGRMLRVSGVLLGLWLLPVAALFALPGPDQVFAQIAAFFSVMAVVTFGGAYAVLAYVAQEAVQNFGWLAPGEMLDGLGMAETTPGPLILVTQFVGFMGAFRAQTGLPPLLAGTLGGLLTTWVTFVPCFLWIFLGAPFIERLRGNARLAAALTAVTAAIVGVILNLALWFALHVVFAELRPVSGFGLRLDWPVWSSIDLTAAGIAVLAMVAVLRLKLGAVTVLAACAAAGLALGAAGLA